MQELTQEQWKEYYERLEKQRLLPFRLWRKAPDRWLASLYLVRDGLPVAALMVDLPALVEACEKSRQRLQPCAFDVLDGLLEHGRWNELPGFALSGSRLCRFVRWPERLPPKPAYHRLNEWLAVGGWGYSVPLPGFEHSAGEPEWLSEERLNALMVVEPSAELVRLFRLKHRVETSLCEAAR